MAGALGKAVATRQRMLGVIEEFTNKYPTGGMTSQHIARKLDLHQDTASRYLGILWRKKRLLRAKNIDGYWEYRFLPADADLEKHRKQPLGNKKMHAHDDRESP